MAREYVETEIRDRRYRFQNFGFDDWGTITAELAKIASPAAGVFGAMHLKGEADIGAALHQLAMAVLSGAKDGLLDKLCADLSFDDGKPGSPRWVSLKSATVRNIWAGKYIEGVLVLKWILEVAFGDFFAELSTLYPELSGLLAGIVSPTEESMQSDSGLSEQPQ